MSSLKDIRAIRGLGIRSLAKIAGVSTHTVMKAERGNPVLPSSLKRIAAALEVLPEEITDVVVISREKKRPA